MSDKGQRDQLYRDRDTQLGDFVFDDTVATVFPDMIERSVPGYPAIINMIRLLAERFAQADSALFDLGCSLGASTVALAEGAGDRGCRIVGVDNAPPMLARAAELTAERHPEIEWRRADVRDVAISDASVVVLNFTLQFIPTDDRLALLSGIRRGLRPGGILILSEKIAGDDTHANTLLTGMHHAFKRANGYSDLEISRKRNALENVLLPETLARHYERLRTAGFARSDLWFQCFNFVSLVACR